MGSHETCRLDLFGVGTLPFPTHVVDLDDNLYFRGPEAVHAAGVRLRGPNGIDFVAYFSGGPVVLGHADTLDFNKRVIVDMK